MYFLNLDMLPFGFARREILLSRRTNACKIRYSMSNGYRLTEHTADIGLVAGGHNLGEAYASAARGMFSIITDLRKVHLRQSVTIDIAEQNLEMLLFEWLNRLLYCFDTRSLILRSFKVELAGCSRLTAVCRGEKYDPGRHIIKTGIKAATFHKLSVQSDTAIIRVIFDV